MKFENYSHTGKDGDTSVIRAHVVTDDDEPQPVQTTGGTVTPVTGDVVIDNGTQYVDVVNGEAFSQLGYEREESPVDSGGESAPVSTQDVEAALHNLSVPSGEEFRALDERVKALEAAHSDHEGV